MVVVVMIVLVGQLYRLTVLQGEELRYDAERVLIERELLPTIRGRVFDRYDRVIASDQACFDVFVDYRIISGAWVETQAAREARRVVGEDWNELSRAERSDLVDLYRGKYERLLNEMWHSLAQLSGESIEDVKNKRDSIEQRVEKMAHAIWNRWLAKRQKEFQTTLTLDDVKRPIREQVLPHAILTHIDPAHEADFRRLAAEGPRISQSTPGITIRPSGARAYTWRGLDVVVDRSTLPGSLRNDTPVTISLDTVGNRILGSVRNRVYAEDIKKRPLRDDKGTIADLGGYMPGDSVGSQGIERSYESLLRGLRGMVVRHLDTEEEERIAPLHGQNVTLTIDIQLQGRVQALLDPQLGLTRVQPWHGTESELPLGMPLAAAAVVLDVKSGEILALVSQTPEDWNLIVQESPEGSGFSNLVHRAAEKAYPCGSIVKPLMLCASATEGVWNLDIPIECGGHFYPADKEHFRCWIYREQFGYATHGPLEAVEALARSCNMYFYTLANRLGPTKLAHWYHKWGVGRRFHLGIASGTGIIKDAQNIDAGEVLMMGIGQGPVAWTPLHAAAAFAALARGGYYIEPILVREVRDDQPPRYRADLELNDDAVYMAVKGLSEVVNNQQYGGARHMDIDPTPGGRQYESIFNMTGVQVWGKTGTAQHSPWPLHVPVVDADGNLLRDDEGALILNARGRGTGAHSWFVGLVGKDPNTNANLDNTPTGEVAQPEYVIAVLVEWGGSGSRCAGPIANQIMHALRSEGYL